MADARDDDDHDSADYYDVWAQFYDAEHRELRDDIEFYVDLATEADGPVLEVGCGTGRVYLELLRAGVDADGIDRSAGMLDRLREKARDECLDPNVRRADVTAFEADREYALVVVPFRAFLHLTSLDEQRAALERIRESLAPGGRLAFNVFAPDFDVICDYSEEQEATFERDGEEYRMVSETTFVDEVECVTREHRRLFDGDDELVAEQSFELHLAFKRELELLLEVTGFADWQVFGGFDRDELASTDQEMVWVAER
jgi:SAM-dependent methyltransferase